MLKSIIEAKSLLKKNETCVWNKLVEEQKKLKNSAIKGIGKKTYKMKQSSEFWRWKSTTKTYKNNY